MKQFFLNVKASLSKSTIYESPENNKAGQAIKYITLLSLFTGVLSTVVAMLFFVPTINKAKVISIDFLSQYPNDLVLTLLKGKLSMNQPSPYVVVMPENDEVFPNNLKNIVVIDTNAKLDLETFEKYETFALLTKDGYMALGERKIEINSFREFPDYTLSKTKVDSYIAKIESFSGVKYSLVMLVIGIGMLLFFSIVGFVGTLFMSLFGSIITLAITRIKGHKLSFEQIYALTLFAATVGFAVSLVNIIFPLPFWVSPILFILILTAFVTDKKKPEDAVVK